MLTQELIEKFYRDVESLKIKKKGAVITKATGFSKSNVSEYLRKIKTPSENFIIAFYEHFGNMLPKSSINVTTDANRDTTYALPQIAKDLAEYNKELPMGDLKVTLKDYIELWKMLYNKEEERSKELITIIKDLAKGQNEIKEALNPIASSLKEIPPVLDAILRNSSEHDREIMTALDHLVGNAPGTLQQEAGKRILKSAVEQQRKGKAQAGR
jgi:DNA-binding transcriptional regulator GbsR (MarR family)